MWSRLILSGSTSKTRSSWRKKNEENAPIRSHSWNRTRARVLGIKWFQWIVYTMATATATGNIYLWDLDYDRKKKTCSLLGSHQSACQGLSWNNKNTDLLLSCGQDGVVILWVSLLTLLHSRIVGPARLPSNGLSTVAQRVFLLSSSIHFTINTFLWFMTTPPLRSILFSPVIPSCVTWPCLPPLLSSATRQAMRWRRSTTILTSRTWWQSAARTDPFSFSQRRITPFLTSIPLFTTFQKTWRTIPLPESRLHLKSKTSVGILKTQVSAHLSSHQDMLAACGMADYNVVGVWDIRRPYVQ